MIVFAIVSSWFQAASLDLGLGPLGCLADRGSGIRPRGLDLGGGTRAQLGSGLIARAGYYEVRLLRRLRCADGVALDSRPRQFAATSRPQRQCTRQAPKGPPLISKCFLST